MVHTRGAAYRREGGPWDRTSLDSQFSKAARAGICDGQVDLDSESVEAHVARLAGGLAASGIGKGDVVAWQLPNGACASVLYRACWRLGAIAAPVHHRLGEAELEGALAQVEPALLVAGSGLPAAGVGGSAVLGPREGLDELEAMLPASRALAAGSSRARGPDIAVVLFTSGSSGVPKAVMHTHRGLGYKASLMVNVHGLGPDDAVLMPAPLAHISGLLNGVLIPAVCGIPSVLMDTWDPDEAIRRIESRRVSFMGAPPVFFSQMAASGEFSEKRVASMKLISTGGASVSPAFVETTAEAFGCRVKRTYGSTEAPTVTTSLPGDDLDRARHTDGRAVGEVEIEIHDPESGRRIRPGEPGEIWIRGPELFVGYVDSEATKHSVFRPGGWYRSGDTGVVDDEGWLRVVGRLSDIVIRAGENISTSEVEAVLEAHPSVRHAVAVGVPDAAVGERLAAFVEATDPFDLAACRDWFTTRGVTRFKTPELVVQLESLPVLAAGKPDRAALRKMAAEMAVNR